MTMDSNAVAKLETTPFARRRDPAPPGNLVSRYIAAHAKAFVGRASVTEVVRDWWPDDLGLQTLVRAVSTPAQLGQVGWAQELGQRVVNDSLAILFPASAGAALFQVAPSLTFGNDAAIAVPGLAVGTTGKTSVFVAERQPIPVFQPAVTGAVLLPYKLAGIMVATREVIESSNAETQIADLIRQSFGRALDEVLVDGNPASPQRPPGLRLGVSAITASTTGTDAWSNFVADVGKLADAVSPVAGNAPLVFIGSAGRALRASILSTTNIKNAVFLGSNAVINDFLCVASAALVSAVGVPEVEVNKVATLTMDDAPANQLRQLDLSVRCGRPIPMASNAACRFHGHCAIRAALPGRRRQVGKHEQAAALCAVRCARPGACDCLRAHRDRLARVDSGRRNSQRAHPRQWRAGCYSAKSGDDARR
jgi:hypothetical protein